MGELCRPVVVYKAVAHPHRSSKFQRSNKKAIFGQIKIVIRQKIGCANITVMPWTAHWQALTALLCAVHIHAAPAISSGVEIQPQLSSPPTGSLATGTSLGAASVAPRHHSAVPSLVRRSEELAGPRLVRRMDNDLPWDFVNPRHNSHSHDPYNGYHGNQHFEYHHPEEHPTPDYYHHEEHPTPQYYPHQVHPTTEYRRQPEYSHDPYGLHRGLSIIDDFKRDPLYQPAIAKSPRRPPSVHSIHSSDSSEWEEDFVKDFNKDKNMQKIFPKDELNPTKANKHVEGLFKPQKSSGGE